MTPEELLSKAVAFEILSYDPSNDRERIRELRIVCRTTLADPHKAWAITNGFSECLNHDGEWEYEMRPSSRDEGFLQRCRWADLNEAVAFAEDHMKKYPTGYKPE